MAWGEIWTRPGLELKTKSLLNLVMLSALNRITEFKAHVRGAINNGCTLTEIREALLQVTVVSFEIERLGWFAG
jgi:4-carboxymuconolactone decarboxylase